MSAKYDTWQERVADKHWKELEDSQLFCARFPRISSYWRARLREMFNRGFIEGLATAKSPEPSTMERTPDICDCAYHRAVAELAEARQRLSAQTGAARELLEALKLPKECTHDEEPDYCPCCEHERSIRIGAAAGKLRAVMGERTPER